jgi:hypothetical protein
MLDAYTLMRHLAMLSHLGRSPRAYPHIPAYARARVFVPVPVPALEYPRVRVGIRY